MNILKKIVLLFLMGTALIFIGGYCYFHKKFSPPENNLIVLNEVQNIPVKWVSDYENPYSAVLLPVKIQGVEKELFMQLDSGSASTVFYKKALQSVYTQLGKTGSFPKNSTQVRLNFRIQDLRISSVNFELLDYGSAIDLNNPDAQNIIGTIGTDLLEKRIMVLDLKNNCCSFVKTIDEKGFSDFKFRKRRILLPAKLNNENIQFLYDSGTSGYDFITDKENWKKFRIPGRALKKEKGNSWGKELVITSAPANKKITIGNNSLLLKEVTYITGTSKLQNLLMKSSGMDGMIGNKLFLDKKITLDCKTQKFKIE